MSNDPARTDRLARALPLASAAVFAFMAWRLLRFTDVYAVNLMLWDQWDFYLPLFNDEGAWAMFTRQHGPHRQGLGLLVTQGLASLGGWNSRWDAFACVVALIGAASAGVALAVRCGCRAAVATLVCALLFFNLRQYEHFAGASNLSHGALPVLLLMVYCLAWFVKHRPARLLAVCALNFLLVFTGFGVFVGLITPLLMIAESVRAFRDGETGHGWLAVGAVASCVLTWWIFSRGYVFAPAVDDFRFPHERPAEYLWFSSLMLANFHGVPGHEAASIACGLPVFAALAALCVFHGWRLMRDGPEGRAPDVAVFCLSAFALLYCLNTAVGRVSLGLAGAPQASRYVTLMIPAGLALWLGIARLLPRGAVATGLVYAGLLAAGTFSLRTDDRAAVRRFHDGRAAWKAAYLQTHDEARANEISGFKAYPAPGTIVDRLAFLEKHRLNLFSDTPPAP